MTIRTLELQGTDPAGWGEQHGESFRDDVKGIYDIRLRLTLEKTDLATEANVLRLAAAHLPILERFDRALYAELQGIARGAGLTPAHIVVVNHYTDLRDLSQKHLPRGDVDGCSAVVVDTPNGRLVGQTWDMHGSAEPFALLLRVPGNPDGQAAARANAAGIPVNESALFFSITGCLGMTGASSWGTALTINNLNSTDATLGIVWPALVRKAMRQGTAKQMRDVIMNAPIGSGRHYIVADATDYFGIETSGTKKKLIRDGGAEPYFHTNHCVDDEMLPTCRILPGSTTVQRYTTLGTRMKQGVPQDARELFDFFQHVGLPQSEKDPNGVATCGALVVDLAARSVIACAGIPGPDADAIGIELRS